MIPFLLIAGGAYLLYDSLSDKRVIFDPLEEGFPTKGFRGYRRGKAHFSDGGNISEDDFEKANKWWNGLKQHEREQIFNENFQENETISLSDFEQWLVKVYERAHNVMPMRPSRYGFFAGGGNIK